MQEVFLEGDLGQMDPLPFLEPGDVARRDLRHCDEGGAGVPHVRQTDGIPHRLGHRRLATELRLDVVAKGANHRLNHVASLGYAGWHRGFMLGRDGDADPGGVNLREGGIALVFVDDDKTAGIDQPLDASQRRNADKGGQHHGVFVGQSVGALDVALIVQLLHRHLAILCCHGAGIADPLHIAHPQFALQHSLGVAYAVQTQMADVGLAGDKGHGHIFSHLFVAQVAIEDEGVLVGRAKAGGPRHGADNHRAGLIDQ